MTTFTIDSADHIATRRAAGHVSAKCPSSSRVPKWSVSSGLWVPVVSMPFRA